MYNYNWPSDNPIVIDNIFNSGVSILKEKFGAFSQDPNNLHSGIYIGNSLTSIESYRGCPLSCVYCMANNDVRSLNVNIENINELNRNQMKSVIIKTPEKTFSTVTLVKALVKHPDFYLIRL